MDHTAIYHLPFSRPFLPMLFGGRFLSFPAGLLHSIGSLTKLVAEAQFGIGPNLSMTAGCIQLECVVSQEGAGKHLGSVLEYGTIQETFLTRVFVCQTFHNLFSFNLNASC